MSNLLELDIEFRFFTAPLALGLAVFGWYGPKWLGRFRWVALGVAMPMAIPLALSGMYVVYKWPLERTLDHDEIVAGEPLYAGSRIRFRDSEHTRIELSSCRVSPTFPVFLSLERYGLQAEEITRPGGMARLLPIRQSTAGHAQAARSPPGGVTSLTSY